MATVLARQSLPLFAILDGARVRSLSRQLRVASLFYQSLYEGEIGEELAPFGPYLVEMPHEGSELERWTDTMWGKSHGVYLTSRAPLAVVRRHLRRYLMVELEGGKRAYFRFYDPRVLRLFLPNCTYEEWIDFFGPIDAYLAESEDGQALLRYFRDADEPEPERILLISETRGT